MFVKRRPFVAGIIILFVIAAIAFYLIFTPRGLGFLAKLYVSKTMHPESIDIGKIESNLPEEAIFKDIELKDIRGLPEGSILKIQELRASLLNFKLHFKINNGSLRLPNAEPVIFFGTYKEDFLDFNVYSKYINIKDILDLFPKSEIQKNLKGKLADADIYARGSLSEPELKGEFIIKDARHKTFSVSECYASFDIKLKKIGKELEIYGESNFREGKMSARNTFIEIQDSAINFSGEPGKSKLDIKGKSNIEGVTIAIALRGTLDKPDLKLASVPPMPQDRLMIMLATGRAWKGTGALLTQGQVSPDLIAEFIDYLVLGGSGSRFAKMLGISEVSLRYDQKQKGIKIKKAVSDKLEATYEIEQPQVKEGEPVTTHKVGSEYKITEEISIEAEKELRQEPKTEPTQDKTPTDDKVIIKYKKEF